MTDRREWESVPVEDATDRLIEAGLLAPRQAEVFVRREIKAEPRRSVADALGIAPSTVDSTLRRARDVVDEAEATLDVIDQLRHRPLPSDCEDCGAALGGRFSTTDGGEPICLDCADITDETRDGGERGDEG